MHTKGSTLAHRSFRVVQAPNTHWCVTFINISVPSHSKLLSCRHLGISNSASLQAFVGHTCLISHTGFHIIHRHITSIGSNTNNLTSSNADITFQFARVNNQHKGLFHIWFLSYITIAKSTISLNNNITLHKYHYKAIEINIITQSWQK